MSLDRPLLQGEWRIPPPRAASKLCLRRISGLASHLRHSHELLLIPAGMGGAVRQPQQRQLSRRPIPSSLIAFSHSSLDRPISHKRSSRPSSSSLRLQLARRCGCATVLLSNMFYSTVKALWVCRSSGRRREHAERSPSGQPPQPQAERSAQQAPGAMQAAYSMAQPLQCCRPNPAPSLVPLLQRRRAALGSQQASGRPTQLPSGRAGGAPWTPPSCPSGGTSSRLWTLCAPMPSPSSLVGLVGVFAVHPY